MKGPLAFAQFMSLYGLDRPGLKIPGHSPAIPPVLQTDSLFRIIRKQDVFLHHPYDSFSPVLDFVQTAAEDPDVISIKQTLYRVGNDSPIVRSLIEARRRGQAGDGRGGTQGPLRRRAEHHLGRGAGARRRETWCTASWA